MDHLFSFLIDIFLIYLVPGVIVFALAGLLSIGKERPVMGGLEAEPYENKYLVVLREGLVVGICSHQPASSALVVRVTDSDADYSEHRLDKLLRMFQRGASVPSPLHPGDMLKVTHAEFCFSPDSFSLDFLILAVQTVSAHSMAQGVGAQEQESQDVGAAEFQFDAGGNVECDEEFDALVEKWVKVFDTQEDAAKFGIQLTGRSSSR